MKETFTGLLFLISLAGCSQEKAPTMPAHRHVQVIAHRGASGYAPENTIASFKKAVTFHVDYVELDVHLTKDDSVLVIHDASVDRTTNGTGKVRDLTFAETQKLDAGTKFNASFAGEKLPSLDQVLDAVNGQCKIMIEIKKGEDFYPGIEQKVLDIIKKHNAQSWCEMHTFHNHVLQNWLAIDTTIKTYKLVAKKIGKLYYDDGVRWGNSILQLKNKNYVGLNPNQSMASQSYINEIHAAGLKTFVWTVNDESKIDELIKKGVDGIITNFPDKVKQP